MKFVRHDEDGVTYTMWANAGWRFACDLMEVYKKRSKRQMSYIVGNTMVYEVWE